MNTILQLKISLKNSTPPIWRRILVEDTTSFYTLHHIIQIAMGWQNYHLFSFSVGNRTISIPDNEFDDFDVEDSAEITLEEVLYAEKQRFSYEYDFGDGWDHTIVVEKILPIDPNLHYPICIKGKMNCPPEDCGGIYGFYDMLEIISAKRHSNKKDMLEWLGGGYDPGEFDIEEINDELRSLDDYIIIWESAR